MRLIKVIKRDNRKVDFEKEKIVIAIEKAMRYGGGNYEEGVIDKIASEIEQVCEVTKVLNISQIEDMVYHKLIENNHVDTAKSYEGYRAVQEHKREHNTTDDSIVGLINFKNEDLMRENSNKDAVLSSTQRDLIAGEVSKDLYTRKMLPAHLAQAHDEGLIHIHDRDYLLQNMHNCTVLDLEDMLKNGTVINSKQISSPKSFQVACTVTTQIIAQVSSSQFGGVSVNGVDRILAPYVRKSYDKYYAVHERRFKDLKLDDKRVEELSKEYALEDVRKEVKDGVQTIQYQINTLNSTNGQSPFVSFLLYFQPDDEYALEAAIIQEEILKQRIDGITNEAGVKMPTSFPKLIYVLDEHNIKEDSKYYYLTELSAKASAKTLMPDYISAKKMKEHYEGNVFVPIDIPVA